MHGFSTLKALLLVVMLAPLFTACGDDPSDPGDVSFPVTFKPKSVTAKSSIKAFVREGSNWRDVTSSNPDILTNETFAEYSVIDTDDDIELTLKSATQWEAQGVTFTYSRSGDKFTFQSLPGFNFYATGNYEKFNMHMVSGVSVHYDGAIRTESASRISYDPSTNAVDALLEGSFAFPGEEGDTIAYQTFEIVYEK